MDLLQCVSEVLGAKSALTRDHLEDINRLAEQATRDPGAVPILHDALEDVGVYRRMPPHREAGEPQYEHNGEYGHPRFWEGWDQHGPSVATNPDHPLYGAYHAARRAYMDEHLGGLHRLIIKEPQNSEWMHHQAASVARRHGDMDYQRSHIAAAMNEHRPDTTLLIDDKPTAAWQTSTFMPPGGDVLRDEIFARLPKTSAVRLAHDDAVYANEHDAWREFHEAYRKYHEDRENGVA